MAWQLGDTVPVTITLTDAAPTTVTLALTSPTGVVTAPTVSGSGLTRSATFTATEIGRYLAVATVTGTGAGVSPAQSFDIQAVSLVPPGSLGGQHATTADYARLIGGTLPDNLQLLLRRASLDVDRELLSAPYSATDVDNLAALKEATCEQVAYYGENGWTSGVPTGYDEVSIGSVRLKRGSSSGGRASSPARFSPQAFTILQLAQLTGNAPSTDW